MRTGVNDFGGLPLQPLDWFVLSRVDGVTSVRLLASLTGATLSEVAQSLHRLLTYRLVTIPGVSAGGTTGGGEEEDDGPDSGISRELIPRGWPVPWDSFPFEPVEAGTELDGEQQQVVQYFHHHLARVNFYDLLQVGRDARRTDLRKSYFRLSKAFHPDRWFRRNLGRSSERIVEIFKAVNRAYTVLSSPRKRAEYDALLARGPVPERDDARRRPSPSASANPENARTVNVLLLRARQAEAAGDWAGAVDAYQRAGQLYPDAQLHLRQANAMLRGGVQLDRVRDVLSEARRLGGDEKLCLLLDAQACFRTGDPEGAIALYRRVLTIDPGNEVATQALTRLTSR